MAEDWNDDYENDENQDGYTNQVNSFREIVIRAIEKCRNEMSKEKTKGKTIFIQKNGANIPVVIPDQRKVVESCIEQLYDLMIYIFDDKIQEELSIINKEIEELDEHYLKLYLEHEKFVPSRQYAIQNQQIPPESDLGNTLIQQKEDKRLSLYRKMYQELILLFKRKNDLSNEISLGFDGN